MFSGSGSAEELYPLGYNINLAPVLAGFLVLPRIQLQPALDKDLRTFFYEAVASFSLTSPGGYVNKAHFFFLDTVIRSILPVDGKAEIADGRTLRSVSQLWIPGEISNKENFV